MQFGAIAPNADVGIDNFLDRWAEVIGRESLIQHLLLPIVEGLELRIQDLLDDRLQDFD